MKVGDVAIVKGELARYVGTCDDGYLFEQPNGQRLSANAEDIDYEHAGDAMGAVAFILSYFNAQERELNEGDSVAFILNDGVVVLRMMEGRELKIHAIVGDPEYLNVDRNALKEEHVLQQLAERVKNMDIGDSVAYILNDGVVVLTIDDDCDPNLYIVPEKPERLELNLNL